MIPLADPTLAENLKAAGTPQERAEALFTYMQAHGNSFYDESVTQLQHALQSASLARNAGATAEQVTAALLHDIGHFLMEEHDEQSSFLEEDWEHETIGAKYLEPFLNAGITEPIRLHVPAKRYLCTTDPDYYNGLSRASQRSFQLQNGKMSAEEIAEFEQHPHFKTAVFLRRWDDGAKVSDLAVGGLESFRSEVEQSFARLS